MNSTMQNYSLVVPFTTDSDESISLTSSPLEFTMNFYKFSIKRNGMNSYSLKAGAFKSEIEAENFFPKIESALRWISLQHKIGIDFPTKISRVNLYPKSIEVKENSSLYEPVYRNIDGNYDGNNAVIICNQKNIVCFTGYAPTITGGISTENLASSLEKSLAFNGSENIPKDCKLRLALELYSNYFFERSKYAKFITLVNVLEALAPSLGDEKISEFSINQLNEIVEHVKNKRDEHDNKCDKYAELNNLVKRIKALEDKGTTGMLLKYIIKIVEDNRELGIPNEIKNKVDVAYDLRSKILHGKEIDQNNLSQQLSFLDSLIPELLKILYQHKISQVEA